MKQLYPNLIQINNINMTHKSESKSLFKTSTKPQNHTHPTIKLAELSKECTFFAFRNAAISGARSMTRVIRQVLLGHMGRVTKSIRRRRGRRVRRSRSRRWWVIVQSRKIPHTRTLLDYWPISEPHPEKPHSGAGAAGPGGTGARVVAVVAAMRAPPSHLGDANSGCSATVKSNHQ